jgi:hypothetical protein
MKDNTKFFSIEARFNNGYTWSKLLNSIKKYGHLIYEAYWYEPPYNGEGGGKISIGEYKVMTSEPSNLKKSLTWLKKTENMILKIIEEKNSFI